VQRRTCLKRSFIAVYSALHCWLIVLTLLTADTRIDWARARARALRWTEQVELVLEEMRRTVTTFVKFAQTWTARANDVMKHEPYLMDDIARGLRAHAHRSANTWLSLAITCVRLWVPVLQKNKLELDWPDMLSLHVTTVLASVDDSPLTDSSNEVLAASSNVQSRTSSTQLASVDALLDEDDSSDDNEGNEGIIKVDETVDSDAEREILALSNLDDELF
jgi:hypothetical protein